LIIEINDYIFKFNKQKKEFKVHRPPSFDQFKRMIADHFGFEEDRLEHATSFLDDLGIDSLSLINFVVKLEMKYGIKIDMDNVWDLQSVGEAYKIFRQKIEYAEG
jgi:acyl carrier protein